MGVEAFLVLRPLCRALAQSFKPPGLEVISKGGEVARAAF
jgi:hypothetical protein